MLCKESVVLDVPEGYGKRACVDHMEMVVEKWRLSGELFPKCFLKRNSSLTKI
jgi:hypothetical protein